MPRPMQVLVVDDDRDTADSLALVVTLNGHRAEVAYDGLAALTTAYTYKPDVVLLDLAMPKLDGYALARRLRQLPGMGQALLVCVSGYGQEDDRRRSREAGCDHHFIKPVEIEELLRLLKSRAARQSV